MIQEIKFTPAGGAKFYYQVWPDGQGSFNMTWRIRAVDGDSTMAKVEHATNEQEAHQQAYVMATSQGFVRLFPILEK